MAKRKAKKSRAKNAKAKKTKKRHPLTPWFGRVLMGAYVPAFIYIHFRYARHNFKLWVALFIAPFLVTKLILLRLFEMLPDLGNVVWHMDLLAILTISVFFYLAERFDGFRKIYVWAVPLTVFFGLLYWAGGQGSQETTGFVIKFALIAYLSFRVGKFTTTDGYVELDDGADEDYHDGKAFFEDADYAQAIPCLEKSAQRGHFKSHYLIGQAYEKGHYYKQDRAKAVAHYYKASRKGYGKASQRYQDLLLSLTPEEKSVLEREIREMILAK
jgi:hypothetical protein